MLCFFYWPIYQRLSAGHSCSSWSLWMGIGEDGVDVKGLRGPKSVGIIWTEAWNHGFYREITTKWPQDSGWWNIIIYPVIYGIMMNCPQWQLYIHGIIRGSWPVVLSVIEGNSQRNSVPEFDGGKFTRHPYIYWMAIQRWFQASIFYQRVINSLNFQPRVPLHRQGAAPWAHIRGLHVRCRHAVCCSTGQQETGRVVSGEMRNSDVLHLVR